MSLNENHSSLKPAASKAGVEEKSLGITDAKTESVDSPPQTALLPCPERLFGQWNRRVAPADDAQAEHLEHLRLIIKDSCKDEEAIKELARPFIGDFAVDGDSYGVPTSVDIVEALIKAISPAVAPSVVVGVEEKRWWTVEVHDDEWRLVQGGKILEIEGLPVHSDQLKAIADAHNASLGEPREKEDLGEKDASSDLTHVLQNTLKRFVEFVDRHQKQTPSLWRDHACRFCMEEDTGNDFVCAWHNAQQVLSQHSNAVLPHPVSETKDLELQDARPEPGEATRQKLVYPNDVTWTCRVHPTNWWHEIGCPCCVDLWTRQQLLDALITAKRSHKMLVEQIYGPSGVTINEAGAPPVSQSPSSPVGSTATGVEDEEKRIHE